MNHTTANNQIINNAATKTTGSNNWGIRQHDAWIGASHTSPMEQALVKLTKAVAQYADEYQQQFDSTIGSDSVLGDHWADIIRGIRGLLNGPTGRLDGGTMDKILRDMLGREGFTDE